MRSSIPLPILVLMVNALVGTSAVAGGSAASRTVFKLYLEEPGVYAVSYEALAAQGLAGTRASAAIGVRHEGRPVPRWVDDGGDGSFDPGDRVVFVGERLRGEVSALNEYSRWNCYWLDLADPEPWPGGLEESVDSQRDASTTLQSREHLEQDRIMMRFAAQHDEVVERWFWARLAQNSHEPFQVEFDLPDFARRDSAGTSTILRLEVHCRGWSRPDPSTPKTMAHHALEVTLNDQPLATETWNDREQHVFQLEAPAELLRDRGNQLRFVVPRRKLPDSRARLIDVVVFNSIELEYPRTGVVSTAQSRIYRASGDSYSEVLASTGASLELFSESGERWRVASSAGGQGSVPAAAFPLWSVRDGAFRAPDEVVRDEPSGLTRGGRQADYIVISHASLVQAVEPLVQSHRQRGLKVVVVDVQDVFDEFNFGISHPRAIRDFLDFAYHNWSAPAPRFVLLVGDASWDAKNEIADDESYADWVFNQRESRRFIKNDSTPYAEGFIPNDRNLVPTWNYPTSSGHAASDNWFVCVDGVDSIPDMAIGRFPAANAMEAAAMVAKTVRFIEAPPTGPWRRNALLITNESRGFQNSSDGLADGLRQRGMVPIKVYPKPEELNNERHSRGIIRLFDEGLQLVHFVGHGGRYIWRTGPPDLKKNHDLFTLEHLDQLAPNDRLPVVLSLTCYSAPFDHPTADSIGEKLMRLPDRGAVAVFAASWRNSPSTRMGQILVEELERPGSTVGEAIQRAKGDFRSDLLNQTYNLLGDPALPTVAPRERLQPGVAVKEGEVQVSLPCRDHAQVVVELLDADDLVLAARQEMASGESCLMHFAPADIDAGAPVAGARAFAWTADGSWDAVGWSPLPEGLAFEGERERMHDGVQDEVLPETVEPAPERTKRPDANTLRWTTASEVDNFGFDIYRGLSEEGPFERITSEPIPGAGTVDEPQSYVYVDEDIDLERGYYYYIESISISSERERFSPVIYAKPKKPSEEPASAP